MRYVGELIENSVGGGLLSPVSTRKGSEVYIAPAAQEPKSCLNTIDMITRPFRKGTC